MQQIDFVRFTMACMLTYGFLSTGIVFAENMASSSSGIIEDAIPFKGDPGSSGYSAAGGDGAVVNSDGKVIGEITSVKPKPGDSGILVVQVRTDGGGKFSLLIMPDGKVTTNPTTGKPDSYGTAEEDVDGGITIYANPPKKS